MIWEHDQKGAEAGEQSWGDQLPTLILHLWEHALRKIIGKGRLPTKTKAVKQDGTRAPFGFLKLDRNWLKNIISVELL